MFSKCFHFVILTMIFLLPQGAACFFVKHVQTGKCIHVTRVLQSNEKWGNLSFVELSNNCLDPADQYRFRDNGALFNLKRGGCFEATSRSSTGYQLVMLYMLIASNSSENCVQKHAITQTSWGGLSVNYKSQTQCAVPKTDIELATYQGIDPYIAFTRNCNDAEDKHFNFGSVTAFENTVENANCPPDQYMIVKTASFRGYRLAKACDLSDDYSCEVDVTCLVKKQCDGQHGCNITVDDNLFSGDPCPGLSMYLYFNYQCINAAASFNGPQCAPSGPPLNIKTSSRSASSLSFTWDLPEKDKQNGIIISYTACVSHSENGPCFKIYTTSEREWLVRNLNVSTKYYVRVLSSNKVGSSAYSRSEGFFTNGRAGKKATEMTPSTLTFSLEIPSKTFVYFYVVALKLKDGKKPTSFDSYQNNELVTYAEAIKLTNPKPYIAAVVASSGVYENMFILGDGRNTSNPTSRKRRSTTSDYYNGPLEPGTSYSIFQRIVLNDKSEYYSTDWSAASKTNEYTGGPDVLTKISSGDIKAKEGDVVNLLCSAQGQLSITFSWEKDQKPLESFVEKDKPHRSSFLVVTVKDQSSFGKYICHIRDRFQSTSHTIWVQKLEDTGKDDDGSENYLAGIIVLVLAALLAISFVVIAYLIYQNRRFKSSKANPENKSKEKNNSTDIYENPDKIQDNGNYEQVESEQSTYTALQRTEKDENGHLYSHLNEVNQDYLNQNETGF